MTRLARALVALLIAAGTLAAPAEARAFCHVWLLHRGQPVACQAHTVRPWAGFIHR
jgi:hypothetical protein